MVIELKDEKKEEKEKFNIRADIRPPLLKRSAKKQIIISSLPEVNYIWNNS